MCAEAQEGDLKGKKENLISFYELARVSENDLKMSENDLKKGGGGEA